MFVPQVEGEERTLPNLKVFADAEMVMSHLLSPGAEGHSLNLVKGLKGKKLSDSENVMRHVSMCNKFAQVLEWRKLVVPDTTPTAPLVVFFQQKIKTNAGERAKNPKVSKRLGGVLDCVFNAFHSFAATEARRWTRRQLGIREEKSVHNVEPKLCDFILDQINVDDRMAQVWLVHYFLHFCLI